MAAKWTCPNQTDTSIFITPSTAKPHRLAYAPHPHGTLFAVFFPSQPRPFALWQESSMALLEEQHSQHWFYLAPTHWFGRNRVRAHTVLDNPGAAQLHAHIGWTGSEWALTDHSECGVLIDGKAAVPRRKTGLVVDQTLQFGRDATQRFKIINLDAPGPLLIPLTQPQAAISLDSRHGIPNDISPLAFIGKHGDGQWRWEQASDHLLLQDGDTLQVAGQDWLFFDKPGQKSVAAPSTLPVAQFDFTVSQNEEHVQLALQAREQQINLGERTHHYCLLTLARKRFMDAQQGFDRLSQGWISTSHFAAMLGVEEKHANMMLTRVRRQLCKETPMGEEFSRCIERRRGELRFGTFGFRITRGCQLEAVFEPEYR
jgi:hypothetical protein